MRWGFTHMGRFSVEYRLRFGESPSQTLSRAEIAFPVCEVGNRPASFADFRAEWWKARFRN
jgi:hypothetical protein